MHITGNAISTYFTLTFKPRQLQGTQRGFLNENARFKLIFVIWICKRKDILKWNQDKYAPLFFEREKVQV